MGQALATEPQHRPEKVGLTLYELSEEMKALDELIFMQDGEFDEPAEALYEEQVAKMATKADDFGRYLRTRESLAANIKEEEKRLAARRKALENHVDRLKRYAVMALRNMGRPKVEGTTFTLAVQKNPPALDVQVSAEQLPEEFVRFVPATIETDKAALLAAVKAGREIPGVALVEGYHLRVR